MAGTLEPQTLAKVRRRFAAINLATGEALSAVLAPEDLIIIHGKAARAALDALDAYCRGDTPKPPCRPWRRSPIAPPTGETGCRSSRPY